MAQPRKSPPPTQSGKPKPKPSTSTPTPPPTAAKQYLILYNLVSLILWSILLLRIILVIGLAGSPEGAVILGDDYVAAIDEAKAKRVFDDDRGRRFERALSFLYPAVGEWAKWIQTVALLEIAHSLLGLVRASPFTTGMQVASRLILVWGIVGLFGEEGLLAPQGMGDTSVIFRVIRSFPIKGITNDALYKNRLAYLGMLSAWNVTEIIRYGYFVMFLGSKQSSGSEMNMGMGTGVPKWLTWLRYNTFFILYPLGISSEWWLVYRSLPYAKNLDIWYWYFLTAALGLYVPGAYILYTHMMSQRRKVSGGKQKKKR